MTPAGLFLPLRDEGLIYIQQRQMIAFLGCEFPAAHFHRLLGAFVVEPDGASLEGSHGCYAEDFGEAVVVGAVRSVFDIMGGRESSAMRVPRGWVSLA